MGLVVQPESEGIIPLIKYLFFGNLYLVVLS